MKEKIKENLKFALTMFICIVVLIALFYYALVIKPSIDTDELKKIQFASLLDYGLPDNTSVIVLEYPPYSIVDGEWYKLSVIVTYDDAPWNNYRGYIYFKSNGENHVKEG